MKRALFVLFLVACKSKPIEAPLIESATPLASAPPLVTKDAAPDPPKIKPGQHVKLSPAEIAVRETYQAALLRGRKETVAKNYEAAIGAFGEALDKRPNDARAFAERGYAELLANKLDDAARDLEQAVKNVVKDDDLLGQALFNQGLVHEKKGDAERARVSFARAARVRPSKAIDAKLAGKSRCTAQITKSKAARYAADAGYVSQAWAVSWREAFSVIDQSPSTLSEADAKKAACVTSSGSASEPPVPSKCDGMGPWTVSRDHVMFHDRTHFIAPRGARMLVVDAGMLGSRGCGPMGPGSAASADARLEGDLLVVTSEFESEDYVELKTDAGESDFECRASDKSKTIDVYDLAADGLVSISSPVAFPSVTFDGKTVVLSGEGCSERITF